MAAINITLVPAASVDAVWSKVAAQIGKCLDKTPSYISAGELWQMCRVGSGFLLVAHDETTLKGAAIWQFQQGYGQTIFDCLMLVGEDLDQWAIPLFETAKTMARDGGATALSATGRVGLVQTLKTHIPGLQVVRQSYLVEV